MADPTLLAQALSDTESMGEETVRFQELLLKASKELQQAQTARPESTQIQPKPGFCIKTNSPEGKVFINICHSASIPPPADVTEDELLQMLEEDQAGFRIPMSLGEPHAELDASPCPRETRGCAPCLAFLRSLSQPWEPEGSKRNSSVSGSGACAPWAPLRLTEASERVVWKSTGLI